MNYQELLSKRNASNKFMDLVGIKITEMEPGYAAGEITLTEHHRNVIGSVHGGCIFTLADTVSGAAAISMGYRATTISSDFHFLSPALTCQKLISSARLIKDGKTIGVYDVDVRDENGKLLSKGTFSYFNLEKIDLNN